MKTKVLELLNKIATEDSKKESYKAEKELCDILTSVIKKKEAVENLVGAYIDNYPMCIKDVENIGEIKCLPDTLLCNETTYDEFYFRTEWFDINYEEYFKELKTKQLNYKKNLIEKLEISLNDHKKEYEKLLNLEYKEY